MTTARTKPKPSAGDTLGVYTGEFLVSPIPLELSFNFCSHKCRYCFANLNRPARHADVSATMRLLAGYHDRDTLTAHLLREGYPVLVSNRVDPFAASNHRQSLPVLRVMAAMGIPVAIQTRGGFGVDEAIDFLPPSVWYISVTTLDDSTRKRLEPGAPTTESRFVLMNRLRDKGHRVVLGYNPCVRDWQADPGPLVRLARECGAEGAWIEPFHLSRRQVERLTPKDREAIGGDLIASCLKPDRPGASAVSHLMDAANAAKVAGMEVFTTGQAASSDFWRPYEDCYPKLFPTIQGLVNACQSLGLRPGDPIEPETVVGYFADRLPEGNWPLHHYVGASSKDVLRDRPMPSRTTYAELIEHILPDRRCKFNPVRNFGFSYLGHRTGDAGGKDWAQWVDDRDRPCFTFHPGETESYVHLVEQPKGA